MVEEHTYDDDRVTKRKNVAMSQRLKTVFSVNDKMLLASGRRLLFSSKRFMSSLPPHIKVQMPALSPTMTSGTLSKWLKKEGDEIKAQDSIADIETGASPLDFRLLHLFRSRKVIGLRSSIWNASWVGIN